MFVTGSLPSLTTVMTLFPNHSHRLRVDNLRLMVTEILTSVVTRETTMARVSSVVTWQDSLSVDSSDPAITGLELQTVSLRASCLPCDGSQLWLPREGPVHRGQQSGGVRHLNWRHLWDNNGSSYVNTVRTHHYPSVTL